MYYFFAREKIINAPEGFNLLPLRKTEDDKYTPDLSITPFANYEQDIVRSSHKEAISEDYVEVLSYTLMRYEDNWLTIEQNNELCAGILPHLVNRGEESKVISNMLSTINLSETQDEKPLAVMGYIIYQDKVVFLNRFDFTGEPKFQAKSKVFIQNKKDELFNGEFIENNNFDSLSRQILLEVSDLIG